MSTRSYSTSEQSAEKMVILVEGYGCALAEDVARLILNVGLLGCLWSIMGQRIKWLMVVAPLIAGVALAATALAGKYSIQAWQAFKARPPRPRIRRFYEGGFQQQMTRREAALILGVRESAVEEKIKEAHRKVMIANHPDAGGSHYLASKVNEAKDMMLGKARDSGSAF
ncbi:hypothetical protein Dimus_034604 [Dionaea muscipula]